MTQYAKVISLGLSCQPAAHIREMLGQTEAYFFDWLITEPQALRATIENDFEVLQDPTNLSYSDERKIRVADPSTGLMFQHDFPADGEIIRPGFADHVDAVREKYKRRAERLVGVLNSGASVLLVRLAHAAAELEESARDSLAELFKAKFRGDFTFLWASPAATESRRCRHGYIAALKPDWSHWKGDAPSWRRAFEFAGAVPQVIELSEPRISRSLHGSRSFLPKLLDKSEVQAERTFLLPENETSLAANDALLLDYAADLARHSATADDLVVIDRSGEGGYAMTQRRPLYAEFARISRVPLDRVVYASQNPLIQCERGPHWVFAHHYALSMARKHQWRDDFGFWDAPAKALVLCGQVRPQRIATVGALRAMGLADRCVITWRGREGVFNMEEARAHLAQHLPSFAAYADVEMAPYDAPGDLGVLGAEDIPSALVRQCLFEFVIESDLMRASRRITEKSLKPIAMHRPFVVFGPRGSLELLRDMGFATFPHVIDESYDRIESPDARLRAALAALKDVMGQPEDAVRRACAETCARNQAWLREGLEQTLFQRFRRDLGAVTHPGRLSAHPL